MKKNYSHIIQDKGKCPTIEQLQLYQKGNLLTKERFEIENHLLSCEICQDLYEGLINIGSEKLEQIEQNIKVNLDLLLQKKKKNKTLYIKYLSLAASILFLVSISYIILQDDTSKNEFAQATNKDTLTIPLYNPEINIIVQAKKPVKIKGKLNSKLNAADHTNYENAVTINNLETESSNYQKANVQEKLENFISATPKNKIAGIVKDENGNPLVGATIQIPGTTVGTVSDVDGKFELPVNSEITNLQISYIGYITENKAIKGDTVLDIKLNPDMVALNEVVVIGYGVQKKSMLTSAISRISSKELPPINPEKSKLLKTQIDSITNRLKITPNDWHTKKILAEKYIELQNWELSMRILEELEVSANDTTMKIKINEVIQLINKSKYKKALKLIKKL